MDTYPMKTIRGATITRLVLKISGSKLCRPESGPTAINTNPIITTTNPAAMKYKLRLESLSDVLFSSFLIVSLFI